MENQAIIKARLKLKGMKVNLPQAFAERGQTVRLVGDSLRTLRTMVRDVKRLDLRGVKSKFKSADAYLNRWLELQYGWKPLLSDVYGAVSALHAHEEAAGPPITTVKAFVRSEERTLERLTDSGPGSLIWDFDKYSSTVHTGHMRLDFVQSDGLVTGTLVQLGITNPLELAWELLPWSFVADWFIPIGDYLSSLDATVGWQFKGGSYSVKSWQYIKARNFVMRPDPYITRNVTSYVTGEGMGRRMQMMRKVYSTAPLATLPSFHKIDKSSILHVANGIALLSAAISGGKRVR